MPRDKSELIGAVMLEARMEDNDTDEFDDAAAARLGVNRTDLRCLDILGRFAHAGERLTAGRLAAEAGLTTGAVTGVVDRLEKVGYVRREADPGDRRRVVLALTPRVERRSGAIWGPLAKDAHAMLAGYSARDLELILDYLRQSRRLNQRHRRRIGG